MAKKVSQNSNPNKNSLYYRGEEIIRNSKNSLTNRYLYYTKFLLISIIVGYLFIVGPIIYMWY